MDSKKIVEYLEEAGCEVRSYSGRGMYGKSCIGFTVEQHTNLLGLVAGIIGNIEDYDDREDFIGIFENSRTDNMGLGTIVYFPRYEWVKEYEDDYK